MKCLPIIFTLCGLCFFINMSAATMPTLEDLDSVLNNEAFYSRLLERKIADTKLAIANAIDDEKRYKETEILYHQYSSYRMDSALHYAHKLISIARKMNSDLNTQRAKFLLASTYINFGMYNEAQEIVNATNRSTIDADEELRANYYYVNNTLYDAMQHFVADDTVADYYHSRALCYKDSILQLRPDAILIKADLLLQRHQQQEALNLLLETYDDKNVDDRYRAYLAYAISDIYRHIGNTKMEKQYLIVSAISDIKSAVKEYISLRRLATLLYKEGDIARAHRYTTKALDDALFSNARLRTIETSQTLPVITTAYQDMVNRKQKQIQYALIGISVLLLLVGVMFLYARRQNRRLRLAKADLSLANEGLSSLNRQLKDSNNNLSEVNRSLSESNNIKETYIVKFMTECSAYIDKLDRYRTRLNKKAISGDMKSLIKDLKEGSFIEKEIESFQNSFDGTFLELFPNFVEDFNKLFHENDQINIKHEGRLNTTLRIFALYRLGITDNERISTFLRCSMATIYAYRSRMRQKAISPESFEDDVMAIQSNALFV